MPTPQDPQSVGQEPAIPDELKAHATWGRLEHQIRWYDKKSGHCQWWYKTLKVVQVVLAVAIPLLSQLPASVVVRGLTVQLAALSTSVAGALIAILEGVQSLNQFATLWITYRSTAERLKHEKYLFLGVAGPYRGLAEGERLIVLAERVEEHVSTEHANWFNESKRALTDKQERKQ